MKIPAVWTVMCVTALMSAGYASAGSALKQLPGNDSDPAAIPAVKAATAEAAVKDPIAAAEKACLDKAMSTMAMQICLAQTYNSWDAKLNSVYGGLMKKLKPKAAASLKSAQKAWLAYRDANADFLMEHYDPVQTGSEGKLVLLDIKVQIVRERALTLQNRLSLYDGGPSQAVDAADQPIDAALNACLDQYPSTAGQLDCIAQASGKWDAEMIRLYSALKGSSNAAAPLEAAQRAWLSFRAAELTAIGGVYGGLQGTMYVPMAAYSEMEIVRQRALALRAIQSL